MGKLEGGDNQGWSNLTTTLCQAGKPETDLLCSAPGQMQAENQGDPLTLQQCYLPDFPNAPYIPITPLPQGSPSNSLGSHRICHFCILEPWALPALRLGCLPDQSGKNILIDQEYFWYYIEYAWTKHFFFASLTLNCAHKPEFPFED